MKIKITKTSQSCFGKEPIEITGEFKITSKLVEDSYLGEIVRHSFIELSSLEELLELVELNGKTIIFSDGDIEIYDGYRE